MTRRPANMPPPGGRKLKARTEAPRGVAFLLGIINAAVSLKFDHGAMWTVEASDSFSDRLAS